MSAYIAIRVLLLLALGLTAWWLVRPVSSASSGYRREARAEARMATLARSLALAHVLPPEDTTSANTVDPPVHADGPEVERAANGPDFPTNPPDNDMVTTDE